MRVSSCELLAALYERLDADSRALVEPLVAQLTALGCVPRRSKVQGYMLAFAHPQSKRILAKVGTRDGGGRASICVRFSALEAYPEPFARSLHRAFDGRKGYQRSNCAACGNCTVPRHYRHVDADGEALPRCGAYTIEIDQPGREDVPAMLDAIEKQFRFDARSICEGGADAADGTA